MERWAGQIAFVTGASSGIGEAIVEQLVDQGLKVVGFARRIARLEALAQKLSSKKGKFYPCEGDLSKEDSILKAFQWTKDNVGPVSILVNNAGMARLSHLSESSTENWREVLDVNVLGLCIATREAIKQMKENKIDGHIINVNSIAGHKVFNFPKMNMYSASKYAVTALTETLRLELGTQNSKIKVTSISPGAVTTEFADSAEVEKHHTKEHVEARKLRASLNSCDVADAAVYVLSSPKHVNISELTIQAVGELF